MLSLLARRSSKLISRSVCIANSETQVPKTQAVLRLLSGWGTAASAGDTDKEGDDYDYPGSIQIPKTTCFEFYGPGQAAIPVPIPVFRTMDVSGKPFNDLSGVPDFDSQLAERIYKTMAKLQTVDVLFYEAQRQGRLSFYLTSFGEEATTVASAAALEPQDTVFLQYREQGVLLWRGFTIRQMADQCYGNELESGKGRQMPIHYGSLELNVHTISSTLATQLPHAVGAAFAHKVNKSGGVSVVYFGDGASSEGDFHAAMNFAATLSLPVIFICRNNGYAISTPVTEQYNGDGVAGRGPGYGMASVRVDGGDARAVYSATKQARELALKESCPVLIETMSYRSGHHSTSDDSTRYREDVEMKFWQAREPVLRLRHWMYHMNLWDESREKEYRKSIRDEVIQALDDAHNIPKAPASEMLSDVYDKLPWHLEEQKKELMEFLERHPSACPPEIPIK